jgi:hypothetical protein
MLIVGLPASLVSPSLPSAVILMLGGLAYGALFRLPPAPEANGGRSANGEA